MGILAPRASTFDRIWGTPEAWTPGGGGFRRTPSGEDVTPTSAMSIATYFACVSGIAEDVAGLPSSVIAASGSTWREPLRDHRVTSLFGDEANPEMAGFTFVETMQAWCDGWGNAYAEIQRDGRGDPVALWPIHPSRVTVKRDEQTDAVYYWVRVSDIGAPAPWVRMEPRDVFHLRGLGDEIEGYSVLRLRADSLGLALAAQTFAGSMFKNDLAQTLTFSPTAAMDPESWKALKTALKDGYAGAKKAGGILGTNIAGKFERLSINPDEAQALETRQFSVPEVCRWFRRSPSKVGYTAQAKGWATREDEQSDDVQQCLMPRVMRWEHEIRRKLLGFQSRLGYKFFLDGLLRASSEKRAAYYATRIANASMTPNEVRAFEDQPPSDDPNADKLLVNGSLHLLESLGKEPAMPPPATFPGGPPAEPDDPEEPDAPEPPDDPPPAAEGEGAENPPLPPAAVATPPAPPPPSAPPSSLTAFGRAFTHAAARVIRREASAVSRAITKQDPAFVAWADKFYAGQRAMVGEEFAPLVADLSDLAGWDASASATALATFASALWPDPVGRTAESYRTPEDTLAADLAAAVRAAVTPKE